MVDMSRRMIFAGACVLALAGGSARADTTQSVTSQTLIHPGDQISIAIFGESNLSQNVTVLPDGSISYPLIGRVKLAGLSIPAATTVLTTDLSRYLRHPSVSLTIVTLAQPSVLVLGDVKNPGKYQLRSGGRLSDAIASAGGLASVDGPMPDARISNASGPSVRSVSLQQLLHDGNDALDDQLSEGDVVYVPGPTTFNVAVMGAVDHPGQEQVAQGDRLSMAIAKAGNSAAANADLNRIRIVRTQPDGSQTTTEVNLYDALEHQDLRADVALQKGDVIYVPSAKRKSDLLNPLVYLLGRFIP
jgi:polysaccharide export outer membrane protein